MLTLSEHPRMRSNDTCLHDYDQNTNGHTSCSNVKTKMTMGACFAQNDPTLHVTNDAYIVAYVVPRSNRKMKYTSTVAEAPVCPGSPRCQYMHETAVYKVSSQPSTLGKKHILSLDDPHYCC